MGGFFGPGNCAGGHRTNTVVMKILLAVDGSEPSDEAVRVVQARPWPPETTVRVLSAVPEILAPPPAPAWAGASRGYSDFQDWRRSQAESLVARVADAVRRPDLTVEKEVRLGDPRSAIIDAAAAWSADLIILGSHGWTGLKRWILGSVAQHVVAHAPCSVEVVRASSQR
jgi:nucleotide-binding universal stress UspA family protein